MQGLRLRARCYALRVATVDRLERERNAAVRERDLVRAANERLAERAARAEHLVADRCAVGIAEELGAELQSTGHRVTGDLVHDVDVAIDVERERRAQDHVAVARALGLADPGRYAFHLDLVLATARRLSGTGDQPDPPDADVVEADIVDDELDLAERVRAAGSRPLPSDLDVLQADIDARRTPSTGPIGADR